MSQLSTDDWLSLQGSMPSESALRNLFLPAGDTSIDSEVDVIIGGGIAGLLLALRLSKQEFARPLILLESRPTLGGRLFQCPPSAPGLSREEALKNQFSFDAVQHCSGPGFELFDPLALEVYERHLRMALSEQEAEFIDAFIHERNTHHREAEYSRRTYIVRKEATLLSDALSGSSEMLTKKEAEILQQLASGIEVTPENDGPFEASEFWQALTKGQREALTPLIESILGWTLDRTPKSVVHSAVHAFVQSHHAQVFPWFLKISRLELALEVILASRGVKVMTQAEVMRVFVPESKTATTVVQVADMFSRAPQQLTVRHLSLAIPLMRTLAILPREQLHPQQSRMVSRHRPRSLVWVEYGQWQQALSQSDSKEWLTPGARLVFPVERVQGVVLSHGQLGFYTAIDFEDSLHAQSVREALNRCRKAALRLLSEPHLKAAQQARPVAPGVTLMRERISLLPVGYNVPRNEPVPVLTEVKMGSPQWYSLGDHFTFAPENWRNVVDSSHEVATLAGRN
jgi:hypothetical protein